MIIVAFDPGQTTGWAEFHHPNYRDTYRSGEISEVQVWNLLDMARFSAVERGENDVIYIVYESFLFRRGKSKVDYTPAEVIGRIKEWAHQHGIALFSQSSAEAKAFWTDEKLRRAGVYKERSPHANDAMRHLLYFLWFGRGRNLTPGEIGRKLAQDRAKMLGDTRVKAEGEGPSGRQ